jgi:hypothetical protein
MAVARPKRLTSAQLKSLISGGGISQSDAGKVANKEATIVVNKETPVAPIAVSRQKDVEQQFENKQINLVDYWQKSAKSDSFIGPVQTVKRPLDTVVTRDTIKKRVVFLDNKLRNQDKAIENERALIWSSENSSSINPDNEGQLLLLSERYRSLIGDQELTQAEHDTLNEQLMADEEPDDEFRKDQIENRKHGKISVFGQKSREPELYSEISLPTNEGVDYPLQRLQAEEDGLIAPTRTLGEEMQVTTEQSLIKSGNQMSRSDSFVFPGIQYAYADVGTQTIVNSIPSAEQQQQNAINAEKSIKPWNAVLTGKDIAPKPNERPVERGTTQFTNTVPEPPKQSLPDGLNPVKDTRPQPAPSIPSYSSVSQAMQESAAPELGFLTGSGYVQVAKTPSQITQTVVDGEVVKTARVPSNIDPRSAEGKRIQSIYAQQYQTRLENERQKAYFWRLTSGRASIAESLLQPRTDGNVVTPARALRVKTFFEQRGISLDEELGSVNPKGDYSEVRAQTSAETMGDLRKLVTPETFRRNQKPRSVFEVQQRDLAIRENIPVYDDEGKQIYGPKYAELSDREKEIDDIEQGIVNFYGSTPEPQPQEVTLGKIDPDDGITTPAEAIAVQVADVKSTKGFEDAEYFDISYTNKSGKSVTATASRNNLELIVRNIAKENPNTELAFVPSDSNVSKSSFTGIGLPGDGKKIESGTIKFDSTPIGVSESDKTKFGLPPQSAGFIGGLSALTYLYNIAPVSEKKVQVDTAGIVTPVLTDTDPKVPPGFTLNEEGVLEPMSREEIALQSIRTGGPSDIIGYDKPLVNIYRIGEAVVTKGATAEALEGVTYYDTALDRLIGVPLAAFKGAEFVREPEPTGDGFKDTYNWWSTALGKNVPIAIQYAAEDGGRTYEAMGKASADFQEDFWRNPKYYIETAVTDVATFITPPGLAVGSAKAGVGVATATAKAVNVAAKVQTSARKALRIPANVKYIPKETIDYIGPALDYAAVAQKASEVRPLAVLGSPLKDRQSPIPSAADFFKTKSAPSKSERGFDSKSVSISDGEVDALNNVLGGITGQNVVRDQARGVLRTVSITGEREVSRTVPVTDFGADIRQIDQLSTEQAKAQAIAAQSQLDQLEQARGGTFAVGNDILEQSVEQSRVSTITENILTDLRRTSTRTVADAPRERLEAQLSRIREYDPDASLFYADPISTYSPRMRSLSGLPAQSDDFTRTSVLTLPGSVEMRYVAGRPEYIDTLKRPVPKTKGGDGNEGARLYSVEDEFVGSTDRQPVFGSTVVDESRPVYDPTTMSEADFKKYQKLLSEKAEIESKLSSEGAFTDNMSALVKDNEGRLVLYRGTSTEQAMKSFGLDDPSAIGPRLEQGVGIQPRVQVSQAADRWNNNPLIFGTQYKTVSVGYGTRSAGNVKGVKFNAQKGVWEDGATGKAVGAPDEFRVVKYTISKDAKVVTRQELLDRMGLVNKEDGGMLPNAAELNNIFFDNIDDVMKYAQDQGIDVIHGTMDGPVPTVPQGVFSLDVSTVGTQYSGKIGPLIPSGYPQPNFPAKGVGLGAQGNEGARKLAQKYSPYWLDSDRDLYTSIESTIINPEVIESRAFAGSYPPGKFDPKKIPTGEQAVPGSGVIEKTGKYMNEKKKLEKITESVDEQFELMYDAEESMRKLGGETEFNKIKFTKDSKSGATIVKDQGTASDEFVSAVYTRNSALETLDKLRPKFVEQTNLVNELATPAAVKKSNKNIVGLLGDLDTTQRKIDKLIQTKSAPIAKDPVIGPTMTQILVKDILPRSPEAEIRLIGKGKDVKVWSIKKKDWETDKRSNTTMAISEVNTPDIDGITVVMTKTIKDKKSGIMGKLGSKEIKTETILVNTQAGKDFDRAQMFVKSDDPKQFADHIEYLGMKEFGEMNPGVTDGSTGHHLYSTEIPDSGGRSKLFKELLLENTDSSKDISSPLGVLRQEVDEKLAKLETAKDNLKSLKAEGYTKLDAYQHSAKAKKLFGKKPYVTYTNEKGKEVKVFSEKNRQELRTQYLNEIEALNTEVGEGGILIKKLEDANVDRFVQKIDKYDLGITESDLIPVNIRSRLVLSNDDYIKAQKSLKQQQLALRDKNEIERISGVTVVEESDGVRVKNINKELSYEEKELITDYVEKYTGKPLINEEDVVKTQTRIKSLEAEKLKLGEELYGNLGKIEYEDIDGFKKLLDDQIRTGRIDYDDLNLKYRIFRVNKDYEANQITHKQRDLLLTGRRTTSADQKSSNITWTHKSLPDAKTKYETAEQNLFDFEKSVSSGEHIEAGVLPTRDRLERAVANTRGQYHTVVQDLFHENVILHRKNLGIEKRQLTNRDLEAEWKFHESKYNAAKSKERETLDIIDDIQQKIDNNNKSINLNESTLRTISQGEETADGFKSVHEATKFNIERTLELEQISNQLKGLQYAETSKGTLSKEQIVNRWRHDTTNKLNKKIDAIRNRAYQDNKYVLSEDDQIKLAKLESEWEDAALENPSVQQLSKYMDDNKIEISDKNKTVREALEKRQGELEKEISKFDDWEYSKRIENEGIENKVGKELFLKQKANAIDSYKFKYGDNPEIKKGLEILEERSDLLSRRIEIEKGYLETGDIVDEKGIPWCDIY